MDMDMVGKVSQTVQATLVELLGVDEAEVTPDADIVYDLGADSLDCVELLMNLERDLKIEISEGEAEEVRTVKDLTDLVERRLGIHQAEEDSPLIDDCE